MIPRTAAFSAEEVICPAPLIVDAEASLIELIVNVRTSITPEVSRRRETSWLTMSDSPILNDETKLLAIISDV